MYALKFTRSFNICCIKFLSECLMSFHIHIWCKLDYSNCSLRCVCMYAQAHMQVSLHVQFITRAKSYFHFLLYYYYIFFCVFKPPPKFMKDSPQKFNGIWYITLFKEFWEISPFSPLDFPCLLLVIWKWIVFKLR